MGEFNPRNLANMIWALATASWRDANALGAIASASRHQLQHFNAQDFANLVWALATLGPCPWGFLPHNRRGTRLPLGPKRPPAIDFIRSQRADQAYRQAKK